MDLKYLKLYPDPDVTELGKVIAEYFSNKINDKITHKQVFIGNGLDEILAFIFMIFFNVGYIFWILMWVFRLKKLGLLDTELVEEFFIGFTRHLNTTLHIKNMAGINSHHIIESIFKGVARNLAEAVSIDEKYRDEIPSTKGVLV